MYIKDPIELMRDRIDRLVEDYIEGECMLCGKKVDYDLYCLSPTGDGLAACAECAGIEMVWLHVQNVPE